MNYYGNNCPVCHAVFVESDDIVTCPVCGTPHHRDCWKNSGGCANAALHNEGFTWKGKSVPADSKPDTPKNTPATPAVIQCPYCGAPNHPNELYCTSCHEPINENASVGAGEMLPDDEIREKMYNDYRNFGGLDPQSSIGEITVGEYSDYLGKKPGSYIRRFQLLQQTGRIVSWNWPAFLLSAVSLFSGFILAPAWFFYRKMNKIGAILLALVCAASLTTALLEANDPAFCSYVQSTKELYTETMQDYKNGENPSELFESLQLNLAELAETYSENQSVSTVVWSYVHEIIFSCLLPVCLAVFATTLYKKKADKDILNIRSRFGNAPDYRKILEKEGGTSTAGLVLGLIGCIVLFLAVSELPLLLLNLRFGSQI